MSGDVSVQHEQLRRLAAARQAIILAHNYQRAEVQDAADLVGDSLELARKAAETDAKIILLCGVRFMAETAAILSPDKTVLMPDARAGCPMANMVTVEGLQALKAEHPLSQVVAYVNTSAAVKAEADICCTSANAVEIVGRYPRSQALIFVPDRNLGDYAARTVGRDMIIWQGWCHVHDDIRAADVLAQRERHPDAKVMAHPECRREVLELADAVLSTSGMLRWPAGETAATFIVATETGLLHRLAQLYPDRRFVPAKSSAYCPNMKLTTLDKAIVALRDGRNEVTVPAAVRERALRAVARMVG